ncbi:MAG TPA: membrane protein insertase YidC, partial [Chryseosolibacter sp.]
MDRNSAIGLTLIAALLLVYFYWFSGKPQPQSTQPAATESPAAHEPDSVRSETPVMADSLLASAYGDLSSFARGEDKLTAVETADLRIVFSSKGGIMREVELKKYTTYSGKPLKLITAQTNEFHLLTEFEGKPVDLYNLYYTGSQTRKGDTTVMTFTAQMADGSSISHVYSIPASGYQIRYSLRQKGLAEKFTGNNLTFLWNDKIIPMEKNLNDIRNNSTVTWYEVNEGFEKLKEASSGSEMESITQPLKWFSIKQKFFLSALVAENSLSGGEMSTVNHTAD